MGSIYKRIRKRPIPANAEIVTSRGKKYAGWVGRNKRQHRAILSEDETHMLAKSEHWYIAYIDENGNRAQENTKTRDKEAARKILEKKELRARQIENGLVDPAAEKLEAAAKTSLVQHVKEFRKHLEDKGLTQKHVNTTINYTNHLIDLMDVSYYRDLTSDGILAALRRVQEETTKSKKGKVLSRRGHATRGPTTANNYLKAFKTFCQWMNDAKKTVVHPARSVKKFTTTTDVRHDRRAMTADEFRRLYETAYNADGKVQGVDGPTRATIYLTAALTGLRKNELANLKRDDFWLDDDMPVVRILGAYAKNNETDEIPLHPEAVARLRKYFDETDIEGDQLVFPLVRPGGGLRATAKMMKADLTTARAAWIEEAKEDKKEKRTRTSSDFLKYKNAKGVVDFHANRVLFITSLCRSSVNLTMAQKLARHSDPKLTANIYTKVEADERAQAVKAIKFDIK